MILDRLVQGLKNLTGKNQRSKAKQSRSSVGRFEALESRRALAVDLCPGLHGWLSITSDSPLAVAPRAPYVAPAIQADTPLVPNIEFGSFGAAGGGSDDSYLPPEIVYFDYEWVAGEIVVYGWVEDDGDLEGILVSLAGPLGGAMTYTQSGGYFTFAADFSAPFGTISAVAMDYDGMISDTVFRDIR